MTKIRKKSWLEKVTLVQGSFNRAERDDHFSSEFYQNLFFLEPKIKDYFKDTDFDHQNKALRHGLVFLVGFLNHTDENSRNQILRLAKTHSKEGLNIHPHHYYYWIEALIMTAKKKDPQWYNDLEYYWREVITMPISFMVSQYYTTE